MGQILKSVKAVTTLIRLQSQEKSVLSAETSEHLAERSPSSACALPAKDAMVVGKQRPSGKVPGMERWVS